MPSEKEVEDLAEAMWQLLDDMGKSGQSVCLAVHDEAIPKNPRMAHIASCRNLAGYAFVSEDQQCQRPR